jgi:hypothetical protein
MARAQLLTSLSESNTTVFFLDKRFFFSPPTFPSPGVLRLDEVSDVAADVVGVVGRVGGLGAGCVSVQ